MVFAAKDLVVKRKVWLEYKGKPIMSTGRCSLLKNIQKTGSIKKSAKLIGVCEKTAHNYLAKMESRLGKKLVMSKIGGKNGGASASLSTDALVLIKKFESIK